jgi:hypothetical protein
VNGGGGYHQEPANLEMEDMEWKAQVSYIQYYRHISAYAVQAFSILLVRAA